jgi:hypothetical protein
MRRRPARKASLGIWARKLLLFSVTFLIFGELASRGVCWYRKSPFWSRDCVWYAFYPQLRTSGVEDAVISNTDETYDILILGGSTISDGYGSIGRQLAAGLQQRLGRPVRVFNLAAASQNSRDSVLKYRRLAHQHFDLVVVYEGINDTRMNNAPPDQFCDDYSHCIWYKHLNLLDKHPFVFQAALPFVLAYTADHIAWHLGLTWYVPFRDASPDALEYGKNIRTRAPFQNHLWEIVTSAKSKGERVVVMTFSCHVPADYSLEGYQARRLDYAEGPGTGCPVELWGRPEYMMAALEQHNDAVRELAAQHPEVVFVDQQHLLPRSAKSFRDCCHLTEEGCTLFTQNILNQLEAPNSGNCTTIASLRNRSADCAD